MFLVSLQNFIVGNNLVCRFDRFPARAVKGEVCFDTADIYTEDELLMYLIRTLGTSILLEKEEILT